MSPLLTAEVVAQMQRDMAAGTPGPWFVAGVRVKMERQQWLAVSRYDEANKRDENICCAGYDPKTGLGSTDARRIARLPDLEAAVIALATQLAERDAELAQVKADLCETEAIEMQHGAVIERLSARVAALTEALEGCVAAIEHADMADGVCCCGDMMEGHSDPMSCGHSPVDQGHYHSHQVLASARAALTTDKEPT